MATNLKRFFLNRRWILGVLVAITACSPSTVSYALDTQFYSSNDILFYNPGSSVAACSTGSADLSVSGGTTPSGIDDYTPDQVKAFAHESITSTWNISDSTVEQWWLEQGNSKSKIGRYNLTSSNIGQITAAVKAAGVSPVFFYAYATNEGDGLGGFINHFTSDSGGGGVADAKRDAEYIASQAQKTSDDPAWFDYGPPRGPDFVPKDIQAAGNADFKSMPKGTIGRVYIAATAAAAWAIYYPDGLKKSVNTLGDYGNPVEGTMKSIKRMGGDPMTGGAAVSASSDGCAASTASVTGTGMTKAINFATMIASNDGYGYDQGSQADSYSDRETGWQKWQSDPSCTNQCASFDCSSLVSAALTEAGYYTTNPNFATDSEGDALQKIGFKKVAVSSFDTSKDLLPGDILVAPGSHTEIYIGNDQTVGAHIDENGNAHGGKVGDQTGKEISVVPYKNHPWESAWRATK